MFQRRPNLIRSAVLAALAGHVGMAQGQQSAPTEELEEVVVTGIRSSYRASLETKREETAVVDGYTRFDATIAYLQKKYDIRLNLQNLSDKKYFETASAGRAVPATGRTAIVTVAYRF